MQISKRFKRAVVSLSNMFRSKMFMTQQNLLRTLEIRYKSFNNSHLKFEGKKEKLKNSIFKGPLIVNQTFSQTKFDIGKSDFAHVMHYAFSLNQISNIREVGKYRPLKDGFHSISQKFYRAVILRQDQKFKLLADISFESCLQNIALSSLQLFSCASY